MKSRALLILAVCSLVVLNAGERAWADDADARLLAAIATNQKIVYPNEGQFVAVLDWINHENKLGKRFENLRGQFHLDEFSNYRNSHSDHSWVDNDGVPAAYHMKIFICDLQNDNGVWILIFENGGSSKIDRLLECFQEVGGTFVERRDIVDEILHLPGCDTLGEEPLQLGRDGLVTLNYFQIEGWDSEGNEINPYSTPQSAKIRITRTAVKFQGTRVETARTVEEK
jgi:hypothetical protein